MIEQLFGEGAGWILEYIVLGMAVLLILLFILFLVQVIQNRKLKKAYRNFMSGKDMKSLEDTLMQRLHDIQDLAESNRLNNEKMNELSERMKNSFQKVGLIKYNALDELGGKLSFTLALLNQSNDGFILNVIHSRNGCYTYIKDIIKGNSVLVLTEEEQESLNHAMK